MFIYFHYLQYTQTTGGHSVHFMHSVKHSLKQFVISVPGTTIGTMKPAEQEPELPPQGVVAAGVGLGMINGLVISIPVSAELNNEQSATSEASTEQRDLPIIDAVDPAVLVWTLPVGVVIGGMLGIIKARVQQRGQSFFKTKPSVSDF